MNLVITADWVMTAADRVQAELAIATAYDEMLPLAKLALNFLSNPWDFYSGTLTVALHKNVFDNRSGQTHWSPPGADSKIEIAWDVQHQEGQAPLRHEFGHWLALQAGDPHWGEFGHGTPNDSLMKALKGALKTAYWGNMGTALLGYKEIDFTKDEGREWMWKFKVVGGKMQTSVYDKEAT